MKTKYSLTLLFSTLLALGSLQAADHTIVTQGLTYSPAELFVQVGDNVTIVATGSHPTREVSQATWDSNGTAELAGGFGTESSSFTFTIEDSETIYYICVAHIGAGMKGLIQVEPSSLADLQRKLAVTLGEVPVIDDQIEYAFGDERPLGGIISLIDITGRTVRQEMISSTKGVMATEVRRGVYLVNVTDDNGVLLRSQRILIE